MKRRRGVKWGVILLACVLVGAVLRQLAKPPASREVTFENGVSIRFLGATSGTNHILGSPLARAVTKLPPELSSRLKRLFPSLGALNARVTPEPTLIIWFANSDYVPNGLSEHRAFLRSEEGVVAGVEVRMDIRSAGTTNHIAFPVWPRRSGTIECVVFERGSAEDDGIKGAFVFENPKRRRGPYLVPETLPIVKRAGDSEVVVEEFVSGVGPGGPLTILEGGGSSVSFASPSADDLPGAATSLLVRHPEDGRERWVVSEVRLSDSVGNELRPLKGVQGRWSTLRSVLWPDEKAWRLGVTLKRSWGFRDDELLSFTNVAIPEVGAPTYPDVTQVVDGHEVTLSRIESTEWPTSRTNVARMVSLRFTHEDLGTSNVLERVNAVGQPGAVPLSFQDFPASSNQLEMGFFAVPASATHMDLVLSLQQPRYLEFIVPPSWTTNAVTLQDLPEIDLAAP